MSTSKNKKSATGFFIFSKEIRYQIHKACPFFSPLDISKVISEQWKNLPESERVRYREMAKTMTSQPDSPTKPKATQQCPVKQGPIPPIETFGIYPAFDKIQYAVLDPNNDIDLTI
ncbi:HMG box family protein [Trichomonas vaginalis G3]|uniref:HMG box family protein n=1 Tax=Trichomonas vaginalis (strain ATCC PRA-98 / G3) TaxID=412133 RepID=A2FHT4_TRIV3|nr:HMG-box family [Trichomonas vaginalis G3]EAX95544.1 HMG box family protein [Trichomonas vaginalis G3]KAI5514399.1 HMG-box family [Trichomonas vaginalis G3]|eukprot:XP_001308474.1 HMG box family protein [Trichomonas vaginalis G3]